MKAPLLAVAVLGACATPKAPLPRALCAGWEGKPVCELLQEDEHVRIVRCTFAPGVGHERHYHPPHVGYVLEGNSVMRITTASGVVDRPVRAGTSFSSDTALEHAALNVGDETTRYLIIEKKYADTRAPEAVAPGLCPALP